MNRNVLVFIALAVTMLYGVSVAHVPSQAYRSIGGVVVALSWIATAMLARQEKQNDGDRRD